jgi:hypothetical protein
LDIGFEIDEREYQQVTDYSGRMEKNQCINAALQLKVGWQVCSIVECRISKEIDQDRNTVTKRRAMVHRPENDAICLF